MQTKIIFNNALRFSPEKRLFFVLAPAPVAAALLALAGCSAASDGSGADAGGCFVVYPPQLDGFRNWTHFSYDGGLQAAPMAIVAAHTAGPRTEYINEMPPTGSRSFPTGTIIVKEIYASNPANDQLLAMVKRGCDFNSAGAVGWEWLDLSETATGADIVWRGSQPPAGSTYAGQSISCNGCHDACTDNDSVCSPNIRLGAGSH